MGESKGLTKELVKQRRVNGQKGVSSKEKWSTLLENPSRLHPSFYTRKATAGAIGRNAAWPTLQRFNQMMIDVDEP